jgi:uracil-DNA glycosylase
MYRICLPRCGTADAYRNALRGLVAAGIPPSEVVWHRGEEVRDLFALAEPPILREVPPLRLRRSAAETISYALSHSEEGRFGLVHRAALRLLSGALDWDDTADPDRQRIDRLAKGVRRDIHKTHAFVRFREVVATGDQRRRFAAWFEPEHPSLEVAIPFFVKRFADMDWCIATPDLTAVFQAGSLSMAETGARDAPAPDATEGLWTAYYAHIFNPARIKIAAMRSQMPRKYWKNLPESAQIPAMLAQAPERLAEMIRQSQANTAPTPETPRLAAIRRARETARTADGAANLLLRSPVLKS